MSVRRTPAVALVVIALVACGDADEPAQQTSSAPVAQRLSASDRELISSSERAILSYCRKRALALTDPDRAPSVQQQTRALEGVDALIALGQAKPAARVGAGVDVRLFLGDLVENLEGSNCDPAIIARLEQGLATIPRPG